MVDRKIFVEMVFASYRCFCLSTNRKIVQSSRAGNVCAVHELDELFMC